MVGVLKEYEGHGIFPSKGQHGSMDIGLLVLQDVIWNFQNLRWGPQKMANMDTQLSVSANTLLVHMLTSRFFHADNQLQSKIVDATGCSC